MHQNNYYYSVENTWPSCMFECVHLSISFSQWAFHAWPLKVVNSVGDPVPESVPGRCPIISQIVAS